MNTSAATQATDPATDLASRVAQAGRQAFEIDLTGTDALIRPAAPDRAADFQSNLALSLAKRLQRAPRDVAGALIAHLDVAEIAAEPRISGPGFIEFVLHRGWLERAGAALVADPRAGVPHAVASRRVVVDYSSPNVAKEMHVGHLRSTIIGDALVRVLRFLGHDVVPQNHVGDWGTPFGMLIEHMRDDGWTEDGGHDIADLNAFYQQARLKFDDGPDFAARARNRVVLLQGGDDETLRLWRLLVEESKRHFDVVYRQLDVLLTDEAIAGESSYNDRLASTVSKLERQDVAVVHEGALRSFPAGFVNRDGEPMPLIIRKSDGGYGYAATDLAALRYRLVDLRADDLIYVVGASQTLHFELLFETARAAGWIDDGRQLRHVAFGAVLGEDGKLLRTRAGKTIKLVELLDDAVDRAGAILDARGDVEPSLRLELARAVGIGAVKYADLSMQRERDYVFSFERMLALHGNTSVYLQYANARIQSILRRAGSRPSKGQMTLVEPNERALVLRLLEFATVVETVAATYEPHRLCGYLFNLSTTFSAFYERCPVLQAGDVTLRESRLRLCEATSRTLTLGLGMLGIEAPSKL